MKKKFKLSKIDPDGIIYILESIVGLILTIGIFAAIFNKNDSSSDNLGIITLGLCFCTDIALIILSFKMKKMTRERNNQRGKCSSHATGISSKILILEKKKKAINSIKMVIEFLTLYFFMIIK